MLAKRWACPATLGASIITIQYLTNLIFPLSETYFSERSTFCLFFYFWWTFFSETISGERLSENLLFCWTLFSNLDEPIPRNCFWWTKFPETIIDEPISQKLFLINLYQRNYFWWNSFSETISDDPFFRNDFCWTPFPETTFRETHAHVLPLLVDRNYSLSTPLNLAASKGCLKASQLLLEHGATIETMDKYGVSFK